ncbi:MAG: hypothetical protein ACYTEQ_22220 [Planctomycetota bacterium]
MSEVFVIKGIRPKKLKVGAIRLELLNALRKEGTLHRKELAKTVATWTGDKPKFSSAISLAAGGPAEVLTGPEGSQKAVNKWGWLNDGTRPHTIAAKRGPTLAFRQGGFRAKTRPGKFRSGPGRRATGPWRFPRKVRHPGTKARDWTGILTKRRRKPFTRSMIRAMQKGAQKVY